MAGEDGSTRWAEVQTLVQGLEPRIIEMFQRHGVSPGEASQVLEEAVTLLLYRWEEIARPEAWLVELLEYRLARGALPEAAPGLSDA